MRTVSPPRPPSLSRQGWHERAACRGEDPDLFFPEAGDTIATRKARAICARCPVRVQCLEFALAVPEPWGTWGGKSERQRRDMRVEAADGPRMCGKGLHLMTAENTYTSPSGTGWCRGCRRIADEKRRQDEKFGRRAAA
jgi:WhiB family redox-sensing transcriptional regulator